MKLLLDFNISQQYLKGYQVFKFLLDFNISQQYLKGYQFLNVNIYFYKIEFNIRPTG